MVNPSEAPPPGWYPDPTGRPGLLWWDGLDWTHHRRPMPATLPTDPEAAQSREQGGDAVPTAAQLRGRRRSAAGTRQEVTDTVAEVRRATREEVERAVGQATRQLSGTREEWLDRLDGWRRRVTRWARVVAVLVIVVVALSTWASATLQTSLLDWLGERIDTATATITPTQPPPIDR